MSHLWVKNNCDQPRNEQWAVLPLEGEAFDLSLNPPALRRAVTAANDLAAKAFLLRYTQADEVCWLLIARRTTEVRVNGRNLDLGVQTLADRDEICVSDVGTFYFSTETLVRIVEFSTTAQTLYCPRCKQAIATGQLAVNCPQCRTWYHQSDDLPCWCYAQTCALCPQATALHTGFRWTPEEL